MIKQFIIDVLMGLLFFLAVVGTLLLLTVSPVLAIVMNESWPLWGLVPGGLILFWFLGRFVRGY